MEIPVKNAMICGYDTYHDGARKGESVGAFVASLNQGLTQYFSRVSYHKNRDEMSTNVKHHFRHALDAYLKKNGTLPAKVVMFRDGVGEGMLRHVHEIEVGNMREVLAEMAGTTSTLAVVVVTKKMGVKFFLKDMAARKLDNPQPGTVIDSVVTRPERLEFYLVAQSVRAGTVSPTSFNIICNEVGWQPRHFQMLAYKLCHLYYNWPGTIRVPAPCQYAHKLAFITGTALHREPHEDLSDRLFYL
jgi:aubergine-like protein